MSDGARSTHPFDKAMRMIPVAIEPVYSTPRENADVLLYSGRLEVAATDDSGSAGPGRCSFVWHPIANVAFNLPEIRGNYRAQFGGKTVRLAKRNVTAAAQITQIMLGDPPERRAGRRPKRGISGVFTEPVTIGSGDSLSSLLFHLPNFWSYDGDAVRDEDATITWNGRASVSVGPWKLTIDRVKNGGELAENLRDFSGFAVTHVGRLERSEGSTFAANDGLTFLNRLGWFLSFARGLWVSPFLFVGYGPSGDRAWEMWSRPNNVARWRNLGTWFPPYPAEWLTALPGFVQRSTDELWADPLRMAIWWYVESNGSAGGMEGSIVLTQSAFELLGNVLLVEDRKHFSSGGFDKLPAADKIRALLVACGIPLALPAECVSLAPEVSSDTPDGPGLFTMVRNSLVHGGRKNRERLLKLSTQARYDAWRLGLWYLELVLLRVVGYERRHLNRLSNQALHVPWGEP